MPEPVLADPKQRCPPNGILGFYSASPCFHLLGPRVWGWAWQQRSGIGQHNLKLGQRDFFSWLCEVLSGLQGDLDRVFERGVAGCDRVCEACGSFCCHDLDCSFEYWSFEMVVLLSGLLPNPKLETSVLSISLNTCWIVYMVSVGLGAAIRVSNELGAGHAKGARLALHVMMVMAISIGAIIAIATILARHVWGKLYSDEEEVVTYVAKMMLLLALSNFLDGFQCVLSGAARGCGWQNICAVINLGAYYVVGIPCAVVLAFVLRLRGMGLWMGIICALSVQTVALLILNAITNWDKEARRVQSRVENSSHIGP